MLSRQQIQTLESTPEHCRQLAEHVTELCAEGEARYRDAVDRVDVNRCWEDT